MTALQLDKLNSQITYDEGKIIWHCGQGRTSKLMIRLYSLGYRASTSGSMHYLNDNEGIRITSAYSWEGLLFETAKIMA